MPRSIFVLASHGGEVETISLRFSSSENPIPTRMISSHNRVPSMLFGFVLAALSPAFATENSPAENPAPDYSGPVVTPARLQASDPTTVAETAARRPVSMEAPAKPVVITTERLFLKARSQPSLYASVVITTEPLLVQAVAQK